MTAPVDPGGWTLRRATIPRVGERPWWSGAVRPSPADLLGILVVVGLTALLIPLGPEAAPLLGLLIVLAPGALLIALLSLAGRHHQRRLADARETVAVDEDGIHERSGSIVYTTPPSQIVRAWRHRDTAYARIAGAENTLALDLTTLDDPARHRLIGVLRSRRRPPDAEGTAVACWKPSPRDHERALALVGWDPARVRRTRLGLGLADIGAVVVLLAAFPFSAGDGGLRPLAILLSPFALIFLVERLWQRWQRARFGANTLTVTTQGLVEQEHGGTRVVSIPWSAVHRFSIQDGEVQVVTDPLGALIVPPRASDDDQREALRSAVALHRPEALTDAGSSDAATPDV